MENKDLNNLEENINPKNDSDLTDETNDIEDVKDENQVVTDESDSTEEVVSDELNIENNEVIDEKETTAENSDIEQGITDESHTTDKVEETTTESAVEENASETSTKKLSKEEKKQQKLALKEQKLAEKKIKEQEKIEARTKSNVRWFWFFILLLIAIVLLFLWDNHRKTQYIKIQDQTIDTLTNSAHFYKTRFLEKDSALNMLLANYNQLLQDNINSSQQINNNRDELLRLQKVVYAQDSILREVKSAIDVALSGYSSDEVDVDMKDGKLYITMRNKLLFASGSAQIQSKGLNAIKTLANVLKANPNLDIIIEGHTDNVPFNPKSKVYNDNWDLSTARAVEVTRALIDKYDIRPERITAAGRSMFYPVAPNTTVEGRAKNRRIEVILTPNLEELYKIADKQLVSN